MNISGFMFGTVAGFILSLAGVDVTKQPIKFIAMVMTLIFAAWWSYHD